MAKNNTLRAVPIGEFGKSFGVEPGNYRLAKLLYALHPTQDASKCMLYVDAHWLDLEDLESEPQVERYFALFPSNKKGDKLIAAPGKSSTEFAGPDGANDYSTILQLVTGALGFDEGEEEQYSGPYLVTTGEIDKAKPKERTTFHQLFESLINLIGKENIKGDSLEIFTGYDFVCDRVPQKYGQKTPKEGEENKIYDTLMPQTLIARPGEGATISTNKATSPETLSATSASPVTATPSDENNGNVSGGSDDAIASLIVKVLTERKAPVGKKELMSAVVKTAPEEIKADCVSFFTPDTLADGKWDWIYNAKKQTLAMPGFEE